MKPNLTAIVPLLVSFLIPASATSAPAVKEVEVNGVVVPYEEEGSGDAIVFVHGGLSGPAVWGPVRAATGKKYRSISYTQRYYGSAPWPDDGKNFNLATHADDLAKLIQSLNAGPAHIVGWSYGGAVAAIAALKNPSVVRSLILYEPSLGSVLPADSPEEKTAREDRAKILARPLPRPKRATPRKRSGCYTRPFTSSRPVVSRACRNQRKRGCSRTPGRVRCQLRRHRRMLHATL